MNERVCRLDIDLSDLSPDEWEVFLRYRDQDYLSVVQFCARAIREYVRKRREAGPDADTSMWQAQDAEGRTLAHFDSTGKLIIGE